MNERACAIASSILGFESYNLAAISPITCKIEKALEAAYREGANAIAPKNIGQVFSLCVVVISPENSRRSLAGIALRRWSLMLRRGAV
jgi:hypothetical protein